MLWPNFISSWAGFAGLVFLLGLSMLICFVDLAQHIIPDRYNAALAAAGALWTGLANQGLPLRLCQALVVAFLFIALARCYQHVRQRKGLGGGDIKFLAAATIWVGLVGLPWLLLAASISGLAEVLLRAARGQVVDSSLKIAFGPHLCLGLLLSWSARDYTAIL